MDITNLIEFDKELLLKLNGSDSSFLDGFMWFATTTYIWVPTFVALLYIIYKNTDIKVFLFTLIAIALVITAADQISSGIFKPVFHRWRPTHDPEIMNLVDVVRNYRGGRFGFISSHAANTFSLAVFLFMLTRKKTILFIMLTWACICSYSRIYLGVHFPGDILCGAIMGCICGIVIYFLYKFVCTKYLTSGYTFKTERYQSNEVQVLYLTFILNLFIIAILSLVFSNMF